MLPKIPTHLPAVFALGIVSQVGQVLFLRELLMVFQGSELSIGIILAAWLVWVGVGSRIGAFLSTRTEQPIRLLVLTAAGIAVSIPVTILLMRASRAYFQLLPGAVLSLHELFIASFLLVAPACLLLGMQFVLLARLWRERDRKEDTSGAAKTYVGEAAGNMFGGLLFTFVMVRNLNAIQSAAVIAFLMLAAVLLLVWKPFHPPRRFAWALLALLGCAAISFPFLDRLDDWAHNMQWQIFSPHHQLIETRQSKYGTISILKWSDQYSFFQSGHLVFSTAGPETANPELENQDAILFAHFSMVQHQNPRHILLIGGGLRGVLSAIARHPVERIDYIELDEALTGAARAFISPATQKALADRRVRLIHTDGRLYVKTAQAQYDMIIVDVPDPATAVLNRYYTIEFFQEAQALLRPDGVLVLNATSTPDLRGLAIANRNAAIYHTLSAVFEHVLVAGDQFLFYFASDAPEQVSVDAPTLQARYAARNIQVEGFSAQVFPTLLQEAQLRRVNWVVRHHGRSATAHIEGPPAAPLILPGISEQQQAAAQLPPVSQRHFINSDFKPVAYFYTVMFLEELTRAGQGQLIAQLLQVQPTWLFAFLCAPLLVTAGLRLGTRRQPKRMETHFAVLFGVFTTGFSTMTLQIALIFSFQSVYGFVFEMIGVIVALFMTGLALGAYFTNRYVVDKTKINTLARIQLLIALFAGGIALGLPVAAALQSPVVIFTLFSSFTFIAGVINGVSFPLSIACSMRLIRRPEKSAGVVYSLEVFGACAGAVLASVLAAPVWGIAVCCWLACAANSAAFAALIISRRS
ncbi:MAG TPA: fused MFS/spermidine synthase [Levilinea sp.]|nr:fused MFS/spermidine synthase [Levilinea sp.]